MKFHEIISFGGLTKYSKENVQLREKQVKDNIKIHTCNDYENSIEVIRDAKKNIENVSIVLKVYYNYPDRLHKRNRPIIYQIEEAVKRLKFIPNEFILQFCCFINFKIFDEDYFSRFINKIKTKYGIRKIYFECFSVYKYDLKRIGYLNETFREIMTFGVTGYFNFFNRVFLEKDLRIIRELEIPFMPIGILGKNLKRDISYDIKKNSEMFKNGLIDSIDLNLIFLLSYINDNSFSFGVTETSSLKNYNDLKSRIKKIQNLELKIDSKIDINSFLKNHKINYIKKDQYGGKHFLIDYIKNIKLAPSKIKKHLLHSQSPSYYLK